MENGSIEKRVIIVVARTLVHYKGPISRESSFRDDLGADSLDAVDLVLDLEAEFNIEIPDLQAEMFKTVGNVADYISMELDKSAAARNEMRASTVCLHH